MFCRHQNLFWSNYLQAKIIIRRCLFLCTFMYCTFAYLPSSKSYTNNQWHIIIVAIIWTSSIPLYFMAQIKQLFECIIRTPPTDINNIPICRQLKSIFFFASTTLIYWMRSIKRISLMITILYTKTARICNMLV